MRYKVVKLREHGRRRDRHLVLEARAVVGHLGIIAMPDEKGFPVKMAVLRSTSSSIDNCLAQLIDPQILAITSQALLLKGLERDANGSESVQEWWCRFD